MKILHKLSKTKQLFIIILALAVVSQKAAAATQTILPLTLDAYVRTEVGAGSVFSDDYRLNNVVAWADDWMYQDDNGDGIPEVDIYASASSDILFGDSYWGAGIMSSVYAHDTVMMGGGGLGAFAMTETASNGTLTIGTSEALPAGSEVALLLDINVSFDAWGGFYDYQFTLLREEQILMDAGLGAGSGTNFSVTVTAFAGETLYIDFWHMADATALYEPDAYASANMNIDMRVIPEPATIALFSLGALGLIRHRKQQM